MGEGRSDAGVHDVTSEAGLDLGHRGDQFLEPGQQRNEAIDRIEQVGRRQWRKESGAHQQARAENGMFRYKRIVGDRLRARTFERQKREVMIGVDIVNRMTVLGMPESQAIRA